jgi:hypothetical protein
MFIQILIKLIEQIYSAYTFETTLQGKQYIIQKLTSYNKFESVIVNSNSIFKW